MADDEKLSAALEALQAERDIYARVLELSRRQRELAGAGQAGELLAVLADKQKLTDEAARVSEASREFKADWVGKTAGLPAARREHGERLIAEIREILEQVIAEEDACQKIAGAQREGTMEQMLRVQKARRAARAYGQKPPQDPRFKNEKK